MNIYPSLTIVQNFLEVYNLKKSIRILSILMAFVMLLGSFSVMGSAYKAYKGDAIAGSYDDVDKPVFDLEQYASMALDEVDRMLAKEKMPITLSVSLHAPDDETRNKIMPVNKTYNISMLMSALKKYIEHTGRRISFEYTLIKGFNDSYEDAKKLAGLLKGMLAHVNLIPVNEVTETGFKKPENVNRFRDWLTGLNINATIRRELGSDIDAACGQLRKRR